MATTERDYYEVLGLSRGASEAEIKRAFRARARELHPDVSAAPDADGRFKEVAEAYEVLSDPQRRATYDRFGHAGLRRGGYHPTFTDFGSIADVFAAFFGDDPFGATSASSRQSTRGGDVQAVVEIELEEAFTGISATVPVEVAAACARCNATGSEPGTGTTTCSVCGGVGMLRSVSRSLFGEFVSQRSCPECGGAGRVLEQPCGDCSGAGRLVETQSLEIDIPAGIDDGQRIRVRGQGHSGVRGGAAGDVFVAVRVRPDPRFVRDGADLHTAVRVSMTDAALGAAVSVPGLGGDVELDVPAGTQPGEARVLRGLGMPLLSGSRRGDLYVRLDVVVPRNLSPEQREALEDFDRRVGPEAYEERDDEDEGFFRRLKSALR
jgi:molecular chaperone DnaJ